MAYPYNPANLQAGNLQQQQTQGQNYGVNYQPQQNIQPLFPQPQGNVYNISSTLEVANVPVGAGISVALCLNEGFMYLKTMQNGSPLFWAYKITPFDGEKPAENNPESTKKEKESDGVNLDSVLKAYNERFETIEGQLGSLKQALSKKKGGDWDI